MVINVDFFYFKHIAQDKHKILTKELIDTLYVQFYNRNIQKCFFMIPK